MVENGLSKFSLKTELPAKVVQAESTVEKEISLSELNRQLKKSGFRLSLSLQSLKNKVK